MYTVSLSCARFHLDQIKGWVGKPSNIPKSVTSEITDPTGMTRCDMQNKNYTSLIIFIVFTLLF